MFFYRETFFLTKGKKTQNTKFVGVYRVILKISSLKGNWQKIGIPREILNKDCNDKDDDDDYDE